MDDTSKHAHLDHLLSRLVDETATPEEITEIESLLNADPEFRKRYVHYLDLHAHLVQHSSSTQPILTMERIEEPSSRRPRQSPLMIAVAAALFVSMVWAASLYLLDSQETGTDGPRALQLIASGSEPTDDNVAMLVRVTDAVWQKDKSRPLTGGNLVPGQLELESGTIQIEFFSGAMVTIEGPADFELVSANRAVCRRGRLRGVVPPQARGFTIVSPTTELVDLGTEFGMDIPAQGPTDVHVFEGEVDLLPRMRDPASQPHRVTAGQAIRIGERGETEVVTMEPTRFASLAWKESAQAAERVRQWRVQALRRQNDPRIAAFYDFEPRPGEPRTLHDHRAEKTSADGAIVACHWTRGRWLGKSALEFRRTGDRVRFDLPGQFDTMTLTAWVRVDSLDNRLQGLLLTDGYEVGRPHWQISLDGELRLGVRLPDSDAQMKASGYGVPAIDPQRIGVWTFLATVYDRPSHRVRHFVDGALIREYPLAFSQPLQIGLAEIGNWGVPLAPDRHPIRNFNGCIDELTIWSVALEPPEIANQYQAGRP